MNIQQVFNEAPAMEIESIMLDSRVKNKNAIFFCKKGKRNDSHDLIDMAFKNGAICAVGTRDLSDRELPLVYIQVENIENALNQFSVKFYDYPAKQLNMMGITGTSGKTTTAWLVKQIMDHFRKCGYIGTMGYCYEGYPIDMNYTTPEIPILHSVLRKMVDHDCTDVCMEVSSQGLVCHRVDEVNYKTAVFTNLYRDHIDFHGTEENYKEAKKMLFKMMDPSGVAIINIDDAHYKEFIEASVGRVVTYGVEKEADYRITNIHYTIYNTSYTINIKGKKFDCVTNYLGRFNVYNVLCAVAIVCENGCDPAEVVKLLKELPPSPGRMERVDEGQNFSVIVDQAFTPDAFEEALHFVRSVLGPKQRIITLVSPAGNRDHIRRAPCAKVADEYSDMLVLTMDDPDGEKTSDILAETVTGITKHDYIIIEDRYEGIRQAIELANKGDLVMILNKGAEFRFRMGNNVLKPWMGDANACREILKELVEKE